MKIICVEDHVIDQDLARAVQPREQENAPYLTEVGPGYEGDIEDVFARSQRLKSVF